MHVSISLVPAQILSFSSLIGTLELSPLMLLFVFRDRWNPPVVRVVRQLGRNPISVDRVLEPVLIVEVIWH